MRPLLILFAALLGGCAVQPVATGAPPRAGSPNAYAAFTEVVSRVEPVAERECRTRTRGTMNCDFRIVVDGRGNQAPNAFQSLTDDGRPVLTFTLSLIDDTQNADELAFVMGHEAAHHILAHLARQQQNAEAGAIIFAGLATLTGGSQADVQSASELGAAVGARSYSKAFELEADAMGTVIAYRAGYDPMLGAQYFTRLPDPGNRFLGSHPPNADRIDIVRRTLSQL